MIKGSGRIATRETKRGTLIHGARVRTSRHGACLIGAGVGGSGGGATVEIRMAKRGLFYNATYLDGALQAGVLQRWASWQPDANYLPVGQIFQKEEVDVSLLFTDNFNPLCDAIGWPLLTQDTDWGTFPELIDVPVNTNAAGAEAEVVISSGESWFYESDPNGLHSVGWHQTVNVYAAIYQRALRIETDQSVTQRFGKTEGYFDPYTSVYTTTASDVVLDHSASPTYSQFDVIAGNDGHTITITGSETPHPSVTRWRTRYVTARDLGWEPVSGPGGVMDKARGFVARGSRRVSGGGGVRVRKSHRGWSVF